MLEIHHKDTKSVVLTPKSLLGQTSCNTLIHNCNKNKFRATQNKVRTRKSIAFKNGIFHFTTPAFWSPVFRNEPHKSLLGDFDK